jgi:hypothetical protein
MSPLVEACVVPALFLTVTLLGALRPGGGASLVPPSPAWCWWQSSCGAERSRPNA